MNRNKIVCLIVSNLFLLLLTRYIFIPLIQGGFEPGEVVICKNVQKLYKDDILFDNYYISCNTTTIEVGAKLYVKIIEGSDYKLTYNKAGGIYKIERIGE